MKHKVEKHAKKKNEMARNPETPNTLPFRLRRFVLLMATGVAAEPISETSSVLMRQHLPTCPS